MHKCSCDICMHVDVKLFNIIFDSGNLLESWLIGNIRFRKEYSTIDIIFALHFIFELLPVKRKKNLPDFIDFAE
jgi:hypothetical protein